MRKIYYQLTILTLTLLFSQGAKAQEYNLNGGFEYGYTNWTHTISSEADAYVNLIFTDAAKEGSTELEIHLENKAGDNYAVASSTFATVGKDSIYLLRFWARESKEFVFDEQAAGYNPTPDFARMLVTVEGESGKTQEVLYKFRQGMTTFHLPFKTNDKNLKISFLPQTEGRSYYIDGVELLDQNNDKNIDVLYTYIWNNKRSTAEGTWVAGDNDVSYLLPDGRTIWVFNDSFYGDVNDTTLNALEKTGGFIRNAMVVEDVDGALTGWGTFDSNNNGQSAFFETVDEIVDGGGGQKNFYWVGDMIMEDNMVKVHLIELDETDGLHATRRSYIAELSYPELDLIDIKKQASFCYSYETMFVENDTIYLYRSGNKDGGEESGTHVARTPLGNLIGAEMWEFWNGNTWVSDSTQSVSVNPNSPDGVIKLEDGSYAHVSGMNALSLDMYISFAPSPEGPWTTPQVAYTRPDDWKYWAYMPNFHRQLANGNYSVSYSSNGWLPLFWSTWSFAEKYWYRQRYIQLDLLTMSPYSTGYDCAGVQGGDAFIDECGECVGGSTGLDGCISGKAVLYLEADFSGTAIGLEVGDYILADLIDAGFSDDALSSLEIEEGYLIELYESDNFEGNTIQFQADVSNLSTESFDNSTTSLIVRRIGSDAMNGTYVMQNKLTGLVMGTENGSKAIGSKIVQSAFADSTTQYFTFNYEDHGYYSINNLGCNDLVRTISNNIDEANLNISSGLDITDLGGIITAQYNDSPFNEDIEKLIDNNNKTKYLTFNSPAWVQYQAPEAYVISEYSLTSANDAAGRDPLNWTLSASNDGTNWTIIDEVTEQDFPDRFQEIYFQLPDNNTAYSYYRLDMEANPGYILQLAEWKLVNKEEDQIRTDKELFIVQDNGEGYYKIFNKESDMLLEVFNYDKYLPETYIKQQLDFDQESALWKFIPAADIPSLSFDCAGIIGGEAQLDVCGWCYGGRTGQEACVPEYDCNGDLFGDAYLDDCGTCVGGNTGLEPCDPNYIFEEDQYPFILLYPNPVKNELTVNLNSSWLGERITVYNIQGVAVWKGIYDNSKIDLSHLDAGVYILHISGQQKLINARFVKQ